MEVNTFKWLALYLICILASSCTQTAPSSEQPERISFSYDIKPILSDRCFACHGPDANKREAELRLDTPEGAFTALKDKPGHFAIVPADPSESEIYRRVISEDPEIIMPPPESNLSLSQEEIELIRLWIEQGAEYKPHWSFIKPE
ncbi:MAG: c-type cytochrome domain-containing protein, partial [Cyclobacteriaceae bacterium]